MRKIVAPGSARSDTANLPPREVRGFGLGVVKDLPASILQNLPALAEGENITCFQDYYEGRTGSRLFTDSLLPPIPGRTGYSAHKVGDQIVSDCGDIFSEEDVGHRWYWSADRVYDDITEFIDAQHARVDNSDARANSTGCWVQGLFGLWKWQSHQRLWEIQVGQRFYSAQWNIPSWSELLVISRDLPSEGVSAWSEHKEYGWAINPNGLFRLDAQTETAFKCNIPQPNIAVLSVPRDNLSTARYRYIYSAARLTEEAPIVDRLTPSRIELETGTVGVDSEGVDYGEVYTPVAIGTSLTTHGVLTCATLAAAYQQATAWAAFTNGVGLFNVNAIGQNKISIDFTGVHTMKEVAELIQAGLRDFFPDATCDYDLDHFILTSGDVENSIIDYGADPVVGGGETNIASLMKSRLTDGAEVTQDPLTQPNLVEELWVPVVPNTNPLEYQWHLTHFPIYRTRDLEALDNADLRRTKYNDPESFVWVKDLRTCAAFYVELDDGIVTALRGEFEEADTWNILELDDGQRFELTGYIDQTRMRYSGSAYYDGPSGRRHAAAIGNGRVIRGTVTDDILTRTHGTTFTAADLRRTIVSSDGYRLYVTEVLSNSQVRVHVSASRPLQGFTMDPTHRKFYDTIPDETLDARVRVWSCPCRFFEPMPNSNAGALAPGFLIVAQRGDKRLHFSQANDDYDYLVASHNPRQINDTCQDAIQLILVFQDSIAVICERSTYSVLAGVSEWVTEKGSGVSYAVLPGVKLIDPGIGCVDIGSVAEIERGLVELITNEPGGIALRQFNGSAYSAIDYLVDPQTRRDRNRRDLQDTKAVSCAVYHGNVGYLNWRKRK